MAMKQTVTNGLPDAQAPDACCRRRIDPEPMIAQYRVLFESKGRVICQHTKMTLNSRYFDACTLIHAPT
jgi:hypothetical protein